MSVLSLAPDILSGPRQVGLVLIADIPVRRARRNIALPGKPSYDPTRGSSFGS